MHKDSVVEMSTHLLLFLFCRWRMNCFENNGSDDYEDDFDEKEKFRYPLALFGREQKFIPSRYRKKFFRDLTLSQRRVRCKKFLGCACIASMIRLGDAYMQEVMMRR